MDGFEVLDPVRSEDFGKCDLPPPTAFLDFTTAKVARREGPRASSEDRLRRRLCAAGKTDSFGTIGKIVSAGAQMLASIVRPVLSLPCLLRHLPKLRQQATSASDCGERSFSKSEGFGVRLLGQQLWKA
jgi:hypothetical protein